MRKQEVTEKLPSTVSIVMAARSEFNFFPSRQEVFEARSIIIDDESSPQCACCNLVRCGMEANQINLRSYDHQPSFATLWHNAKSVNVNQPN
ncbi:MAG: hypothetical protein IJU76_00095 [Desulfovibrionaceae bacterium]|nr:hypothetical protein [Desulfovibrionaceae bacterium]